MLKVGGQEPRDRLAAMEERQENRTLSAYWAGDVDRMDTHIEAAEAFGWVIDMMDTGELSTDPLGGDA